VETFGRWAVYQIRCVLPSFRTIAILLLVIGAGAIAVVLALKALHRITGLIGW
jgi:hypothetical protein